MQFDSKSLLFVFYFAKQIETNTNVYVIFPIWNFLKISLAVNITESIILATVNVPPTTAQIEVKNV